MWLLTFPAQIPSPMRVLAKIYLKDVKKQYPLTNFESLDCGTFNLLTSNSLKLLIFPGQNQQMYIL